MLPERSRIYRRRPRGRTLRFGNRRFRPCGGSAFYTEKMLVLASQSPRRAELLRNAGIPFVVRAAPVDESTIAGETPAEYVKRLACAKAHAVAAAPHEIVLGADTTVVVDGEILAK